MSQFRRRQAGKNVYAEDQHAWSPVQSGVLCDIQLSGGSVEQKEFGRVAQSEHPFFTDLDKVDELRPDDGIRVTASTLTPTLVGRRFLVKSVLPYGPRGGWQAMLVDTEEAFG